MLREYAATKFDPRSLHCVFLGYNDKFKGYRCLYPPTGRVYIARPVLFDELSFPFGSIYSNAHPQAATPSLAAWQKSFLSPEAQPFMNEPLCSSVSVSVPITIPRSVTMS